MTSQDPEDALMDAGYVYGHTWDRWEKEVATDRGAYTVCCTVTRWSMEAPRITAFIETSPPEMVCGGTIRHEVQGFVPCTLADMEAALASLYALLTRP